VGGGGGDELGGGGGARATVEGGGEGGGRWGLRWERSWGHRELNHGVGIEDEWRSGARGGGGENREREVKKGMLERTVVRRESAGGRGVDGKSKERGPGWGRVLEG